MSENKYSKISDYDVEGFKMPNTAPTRYSIESRNLHYFDINNVETTIKSQYIGPLLRALRGDHSAGPVYSRLFEYAGNIYGNYTMENLEEFEASLQEEKTTILLDYWLLRLAGHIDRFKENADAEYLKSLYDNLNIELTDYENKFGKLNAHPSVHQNEERENLVKDMQARWRLLLEPALNKYKEQWDIKNILLNLAACATVFGLIGLFCKNLFLLTQGKGLQLFQFERAHSITIDKLQKLYDEVDTATQKDAERRTNYFTNNIEDTYATQGKLLLLTGTLEGLIQKDKDRSDDTKQIPKKKLGTLNSVIYAFNGLLAKLQNDIEAIDDKSDRTQQLSSIHQDFMQKWVNTVEAQKIIELINSKEYPENVTAQLQEMMCFSEGFKKELSELDPSKHGRPRSNFSIGYDE